MSKEIILILNKSAVFLAESIKFKTTFLIKEEAGLDKELEKVNRSFLSFLEGNKLEYEGPKPGTMNNNGHEYTYPSYTIYLSYTDYQKLEKYRDLHSELAGFVMSSVFSKNSQGELLQSITEEAKQQAWEIAKTDHLTLQKEFKSKNLKLPSDGKKWMVYPPLSARINHFRQSLEGNYEFTFTAE